MKKIFLTILTIIIAAGAAGQNLRDLTGPGMTGRTSLRLGFTQAIVPFGVWSDKPGPLFENNDFSFYLDEEYGFSVEYQFLNNRPVGVQIGGSYFYAGEADFRDDGTAETYNSLTLEGGGIYGGITLRTGWKHFGVRSAINLGYFTFDYRMKLTYKTQFMSGFVTEYKGEALAGIGSRIDGGFYFEYGQFGIYPMFQMMYLAKNGPSALILKTLNISAGFTF